eukprot:gene11764-13724_t
MDLNNRFRRNINTDYAFVELFNRHWAAVYQLCFRYCADENAAKDLSQNIFLSIWERKIRFQDPKSAKQYLCKSAKYQVLNYLRNKKETIEIDEQAGKDNSTETYRYNPESVYTCNELSRIINDQIDALPEPSRTIFLLSRQQAMSYLQIAERMGISVKTVEKHMSRALRNLKSELSA